jgi:hypothetical protein
VSAASRFSSIKMEMLYMSGHRAPKPAGAIIWTGATPCIPELGLAEATASARQVCPRHCHQTHTGTPQSPQ